MRKGLSSTDLRAKLSVKKWPRWARILYRLVVSMLIAVVGSLLISTWFDTPKMAKIRRDNRLIENRYSILQEKLSLMEHTLADIKHRDHYVYRHLLGVDTINLPQTYAEYHDSKYAALQGDQYSELMTDTWRQMDRLIRLTYYASLSLDTTQDMAENKEEFTEVIPAIWPIDRTKLKRVSSLYGMRMHPTLGIWRKHEGIDLTAPKGTPIYASGKGVVSQSQWRNGYGELIEINHGFGYKSRYAHLSKRYVQPGDSVTRGQVIGEVGNTGVSSGAHLHYEVRYRENTVNPINYFNAEMSEEAYIDLVNQLDARTNKNESNE